LGDPLKKSVISITVAGAACLPFTASAQASGVSIYGTVLPFRDNIRITGATAPGLSPATGGGSWDTPYKYPLLFVGALRGLNPFDNATTANPGFKVPGTTTQTGRANTKGFGMGLLYTF